MTTQKLSSEKLLDKQLFKNMTRRRLPHILVAFLVNFFTISVPFMLWLGDLQSRLERGTYTFDRYIERAADNVRETMVINLVFMFILGIYFGIITLGYMMKRRSAHFYHALPQKRETLYTTSVVSALFCALIGGVATLLISTVQLASYSLLRGEILAVLGILLFKNIVYFLVSYSITVFAGSFSGNGLVQALMSLVIMFYPIATYAGVVLTRSLNATYFWESYYYSEEILQWLSPAFYAGINYLGMLRFLPTLFAFLAITVLLLGGMAIYSKRAIENSGKPIVFQKLGTVLKFLLMFTVTMFSGLFFHAIGSSLFHMLFGYTCGAWLSFMLFNTILAKSPKAMFKGMKGIAIFALVFTLFLAVTAFDVFQLDTYVPDENNLSHAKIKVSNAEFDNTEFDDPAMLAALSTVLQNQRDNNKAGVVPPISDSKTRFTVNAVMYTKLGIPFARRYYVSKYTEGAEEFLTLYADDARMQAEYTKISDTVDRLIAGGYSADLRVNGDLKERKIDLVTFWNLYKEEFGTANYERLSKPVVATVEFYEIWDPARLENYYSLYDFGDLEYAWTELAVYTDMTKTIRYLDLTDRKIEVSYSDDFGNAVAVPITAAYLYDTRLAMTKPFENHYYDSELSAYPMIALDPEEALAIGNTLIDYNRYNSVSRTFYAIDTSCVLRLLYGDPPKNEIDEEIYYSDEYGIKYTTQSEARGYYDDFTFVFPKGQVPASIQSKLQ